jgi:lysine 6-dehydrogenase
VNVVDITFMPEDPRSLHEEARRRGVTAVVDCGVAPGISNLLVGRAAERLRPVDTVRILVGGLPRVRRRPYEYKAGFSPEDVLEEYTRPARLMEEGHVVTRPPLTEIETLDWPGVGTVEAFLTDGLRSLLDTVSARAMVEKTIRYPGHADLMRVLAESGFFGREVLTLADGTRVRPRDLTARLLFPLWTYEEGEEDLTLMRIEVVGGPAGARRRLVHDLTDTYDAATRSTSMARTTAYPCTAVARRIARGDLREPGVVPPERLGPREGFWEDLAGDLAARGVSVSEREEPA